MYGKNSEKTFLLYATTHTQSYTNTYATIIYIYVKNGKNSIQGKGKKKEEEERRRKFCESMWKWISYKAKR